MVENRCWGGSGTGNSRRTAGREWLSTGVRASRGGPVNKVECIQGMLPRSAGPPFDGEVGTTPASGQACADRASAGLLLFSSQQA